MNNDSAATSCFVIKDPLNDLLCMFVCVSLQGKEFETRLKEKKPGDLSDELRIALGMPVGPVSSTNTITALCCCLVVTVSLPLLLCHSPCYMNVQAVKMNLLL